MSAPKTDRPVPTVDEILTWGATVDVPTACAVFGISGSNGYELIRRGEFPARVLKVGRLHRVVTGSILEALGVSPAAPASGGSGKRRRARSEARRRRD